MVLVVKNLSARREIQVQFLGWEDPLEKGMATHSSILAWRILWPEEPGGLQSMGLQRVGHNWVTDTFKKISALVCWHVFSLHIYVKASSCLSLHQAGQCCKSILTGHFLSAVPQLFWLLGLHSLLMGLLELLVVFLLGLFLWFIETVSVPVSH